MEFGYIIFLSKPPLLWLYAGLLVCSVDNIGPNCYLVLALSTVCQQFVPELFVLNDFWAVDDLPGIRFLVHICYHWNGDTWSNAKMQNWHFPPSWEFSWAVLLCRFLLLVFFTEHLNFNVGCTYLCIPVRVTLSYGAVDVVHSQRWQNSIFVRQTYPMTIYAKRLQCCKRTRLPCASR